MKKFLNFHSKYYLNIIKSLFFNLMQSKIKRYWFEIHLKLKKKKTQNALNVTLYTNIFASTFCRLNVRSNRTIRFELHFFAIFLHVYRIVQVPNLFGQCSQCFNYCNTNNNWSWCLGLYNYDLWANLSYRACVWILCNHYWDNSENFIAYNVYMLEIW